MKHYFLIGALTYSEKVSELVRQSNTVVGTPAPDLVLWQSEYGAAIEVKTEDQGQVRRAIKQLGFEYHETSNHEVAMAWLDDEWDPKMK